MKRTRYQQAVPSSPEKRRGISRPPLLLIALLSIATALHSCSESKVNEGAVTQLDSAGYTPDESAALGRLNLTEDELQQLELARAGGLDGTTAEQIIEMLHDDDVRFDIGMEMQTLSGAGFSGTALVELVKMGAVRLWESDLRIMKHAGISEPTILEIARRKFVEHKEDVLSGHDYERLHMSGLSDAGMEVFLKHGGTPKQLQELEMAIRSGTPEQTALKQIGM